jgi:hypothetical protein
MNLLVSKKKSLDLNNTETIKIQLVKNTPTVS